MDTSGIDWEDAFLNVPYIPQGEAFPDLWKQRAAAYREQVQAELDLAYGSHPREKFDLFFPAKAQRGLVVFVHGGFWLRLDKSYWSDLAEGALEHGWAVAVPSYPLAPEALIPDITQSIAAAIGAAAQRVDGPIRLAGHSAGGHLVTRMVCQQGPLPRDLTSRIERVVSISGLHDLRPLQMHSMNDKLGLTPTVAEAESPALHQPIVGPQITAWVGAAERPEFLRQSSLLAEIWHGAAVRFEVDPHRHHFDVIDGLKSADHPLSLALSGD